MAYSQNTITDANAANVFAGVVAGLLIDAGWVLVETLTPSGNYRNSVYKSPGASNLCGYDWYIVLTWTVVGTENYVSVIGGEAYDSSTHILSGVCGAPFKQADPQTIKTSQPTTGYLTPDTLNASTHVPNTVPYTFLVYSAGSSVNSQYAPGFQTLIPSSAFGYWASITLDHVALWTTVASNVKNAVLSSLIMDAGYVSAGIYNAHPVVCWSHDSFEMSSHIKGVPITLNGWLGAHAAYSGTYGSKLPLLSDGYLAAYAWRPFVYLDYMQQGPTNPTPDTSIFGEVVVGRAPDFLLVWGGSIGDTVDVASATYVLTDVMSTDSVQQVRPTVALLVE